VGGSIGDLTERGYAAFRKDRDWRSGWGENPRSLPYRPALAQGGRARYKQRKDVHEIEPGIVINTCLPLRHAVATLPRDACFPERRRSRNPGTVEEQSLVDLGPSFSGLNEGPHCGEKKARSRAKTGDFLPARIRQSSIPGTGTREPVGKVRIDPPTWAPRKGDARGARPKATPLRRLRGISRWPAPDIPYEVRKDLQARMSREESFDITA